MKKILKTMGIVGALGFAVSAAHADTLRVSAWGGFFEETLAAEVYPGFTEATGIKVESIAQPEDSTWMTQIANAARANKAPTDVALVTDSVVIRGNNMGLWADLNPTSMPNLSGLLANKTIAGDTGITGAGALGFFVTLVTNTDNEPNTPTSWEELWTRDWNNKLAMNVVPQSGIIEITAKTFFDGAETMKTEEGLQKIIDKIGELKGKTTLWYRDEGQFQQGIEDGTYNAGMYYHDVAMLSVWDGKPIATTFPKEGGVAVDAFWSVPAKSDMKDEAQQFINYMAQPEVQEKMALAMGIFPLVPRSSMNLSDEDFAAVGSEIDPIIPQTALFLKHQEFIEEAFANMVAE